jgi:hypothetical protein
VFNISRFETMSSTVPVWMFGFMRLASRFLTAPVALMTNSSLMVPARERLIEQLNDYKIAELLS